MGQLDCVSSSMKGVVSTGILRTSVCFPVHFRCASCLSVIPQIAKWHGPRGTGVQRLSALSVLWTLHKRDPTRSTRGADCFRGSWWGAGGGSCGIGSGTCAPGCQETQSGEHLPPGPRWAAVFLGFLRLQPRLSFLLLIRWAGFQSCQVFFCPS